MTATIDSLAGQERNDDQVKVACEVPHFLNGHTDRDAHHVPAVEGLNSAADQHQVGSQTWNVGGGLDFPDSQEACVTQGDIAVGDPTPEQAIEGTVSKAPSPARAPIPPVLVMPTTTPTWGSPMLADPLLALAADVLDDLERVRIANENRLRQLTRGPDEVDADGRNDRGFGLTLDHPDVARLAALVEAVAKAEHDAELQLKRTLRRHPLGPWVKQARGVGEKQAARLLAAVSDPYWNTLHDRPRTVSELWAYCGYHVLRPDQPVLDNQTGHVGAAQTSAGRRPGVAQTSPAGGTGGNPDHVRSDAQSSSVGVAASRARGRKANWSATAKMRAHLVATSIVKAGGPYREVYDQAREKYADAIHLVECRRCGPAGNPALPGSLLSAGHQHARALRLVAKTVLRDLWREAKRLHELHDGQNRLGTHRLYAVVDPTPEPPAGQRAAAAHTHIAGGDPTGIHGATP